MRKIHWLILVFIALSFAPMAAQAKVRIMVDLSAQRMAVSADNGVSYSWPISSARYGYVTPRGVYSAVSLQPMHHSRKYHNSPMPHSIFFHGGYAIHGTYAVGSLGHPASHGCVRISPANAATLFSLVRVEGATIHIVGSPPASRPFAIGHASHLNHYVDRGRHFHFARVGQHNHRASYAGVHRRGSGALAYNQTSQGDNHFARVNHHHHSASYAGVRHHESAALAYTQERQGNPTGIFRMILTR